MFHRITAALATFDALVSAGVSPWYAETQLAVRLFEIEQRNAAEERRRRRGHTLLGVAPQGVWQ